MGSNQRLKRQIYQNTLFSFGAYHVPVAVALVAKWFGLGKYNYQSVMWFYVLIVGLIGFYLLLVYLKASPNREFADRVLVLQTTCWLCVFAYWTYLLDELRVYSLISAIIVFTFIFSYGRLKYSIALSFLVTAIYLAVSYIGIEKAGQGGSMEAETVNALHIVMVYVFLAFMGYRVVQQKLGLVKSKRKLQTVERELKQAFKILQKTANSDFLTGLMNRRSMQQKLQEILDHGRRTHSTFVLAMCDLDYFKQINDRYGHDVGDKVLIEVANRIKSAIRVTDYVCRWGGEEFIVALTDLDILEGCRVAEKIKASVEDEPATIDGSTLNIRLSIGLVEVDENAVLAEKIKEVDFYLYEAKRKGRSKIECASAV